jgi:two-component system response regulator
MKPLSILYLEDNTLDVQLIESRLDAEGVAYRMTHARTRKEFMDALAAGDFDIMLMDFSVPGFDGLSALRLAKERFPDLPVIIVSGVIGEEIAIDTLKQGAIDYVLKSRISRLVPAIQRALQETNEHLKRKEAERALREAEAKYRSLFEASPEIICLLGTDGRIIECNPAGARLLGAPMDQVIGRHFSETEVLAGFDHDTLQWRFDQLMQGQHQNVFEIQIRVGEEIKWIDVIPALLRENEKPVALQIIVREITERKQAEDRIRQNLREKEILLREIHHRVNNNLQVICSLLKLQCDEMENEASRAACRGCRNRIYTMALVHEKLCMSPDLSRINFKESASRIVSELVLSSPGPRKIAFALHMDDVHFPIDLSIPLALILNELVANSVKHAFPGDRKGKIRV